MIGAVAPGRLRSMCAVAAVAGMLFSLLVLCCCADVHGPALPGAGAGVAAAAAQDGGSAAAGHVDPDCDRSTTSDAAMPTSSSGTAVVAIPAARVIAETAPVPAPGARLLAPVAHLLCVMRT